MKKLYKFINKSFAIFLYFLFLSSCIAKGRVDIIIYNSNKFSLKNLQVAQIEIKNNQLIIKGSNLSKVTRIRLQEGGVSQDFSIESVNSTEIIANGISIVTIGVGKIFNLILSNASAAATVPITFSLDDNSITGIKLNDMGANNNDVLTFNGTQWIASPPFSFGLYQGTWDPASGAYPASGSLTDGDFFIVSVSGTYSAVNYDAGDWLIRDGGSWERIASGSNSVTSYNGRKSLVVTLPSDYVLLKNGSGKLPGSSLNDLANVDLTTTPPVTGNVLKYNGTAWVPGTVSGGGGGPVGSAEITDLSITGADIAENTINPTKIYSSAIDSALYLRGDKTWANFNDAVLNVPLSTYTINATVKPTLGITDKIVDAFGKVQKYLNDLNGDYISKSATSQAITGTFSFTTPTSFLYTQLPTGASPTEVANVQYVNNYVGTAISGLGGYAPATLTTSSAATSGDTTLTVASTTGYPNAGTLLIGSEAIIYTGKTATTFTGLTRGAFGTTSAAISNGASVNNYVFLAKSTDLNYPKMVVTGAGNVGIGATVPGSKLEIDGDITLTKDVNRSIQVANSTSDGVNAGDLSLIAGSNTGNATAFGGKVMIMAGSGQVSGDGGSIDILAGQGGLLGASGGSISIIGGNTNTTGTFSGGEVNILGGIGAGANNTGGTVNLTGGLGVANGGGDISITGGGALTGNKNGGSVFINGGEKSGTGVSGNILLAGTSGKVGIGTMLPIATLDIVGNLNLSGQASVKDTLVVIKSINSGTGSSVSADINTSGSADNATAGLFSFTSVSNSTETDPTQGGMVGLSSWVGQSTGGGVNTAAAFGVVSHIEPKSGNSMSNAYAFWGDIISSGTPTNGYGLFLGTIKATNKWSVYASDSTASSYFAGNIGVGTTTPSEKLHVVGNLRVQGSTDCTLGNGAGGTNCSSDIRLKENIQAIKDPLHKILSLRGVEFDWNEKSKNLGRHDIGVIAQEVEKVFPTAVFQDPATGIKKVDYAVLVAPIIQAFKHINKFISELFKASEDHTRDIDLLKIENKILKAESKILKAENKVIKTENKEIKAKIEKIEKILEKIK